MAIEFEGGEIEVDGVDALQKYGKLDLINRTWRYYHRKNRLRRQAASGDDNLTIDSTMYTIDSTLITIDQTKI